MDKNTKLINEMKSALNPKTEQKERKKITLSEMVFSGNDYNPYEEEEPEQEPAPEQQPAPEQAMPSEDENPDNLSPIQGQLPSEQSADPEIQSILSNIRLAVIKGLAKLAEKPQTPEYQLLSKMLSTIDKPIGDQAKAAQPKGM